MNSPMKKKMAKKVPRGLVVGGFAGALVAVLVWVVDAFAGVTVPSEIAISLGIVVQGIIHEYIPEPT